MANTNCMLVILVYREENCEVFCGEAYQSSIEHVCGAGIANTCRWLSGNEYILCVF